MIRIFKAKPKAFIILAFSFLTGCGGSSSDSASINPDTTSSSQQPHTLSSHEMTEVNFLARDTIPVPTLSYDDNTITITQVIDDGQSIPHYQFFLNTDDDTSTGYQFDNVAWDQGGADYLIEDGDIYKSTANNDSWSWQSNIGDITSSTEANIFSITINKSLLQDLSSTIKLGFIARNENWYVDSFYPQSSQMASFTIDLPTSTDTEAPVLSLNGSEAIRMVKGSIFHDPGVYAYDEVDGDISNRAVIEVDYQLTPETLAETVGTKKIKYSVTDNAGNTSTILRAVTVVVSPTQSIVIDGNTDDWTSITEIASNSSGAIKVENNFAHLNILVQSANLGENTQIFIDTDNDSSTGIQYIGDDWIVAGADYMIENRDLNKSSNPLGWSWDYQVAPISYIKKDDVIEIAILKSDLENLGETINIGFVSRDIDWNITQELLPATSMANYVLSLPSITIPKDIQTELCDATVEQEEAPILSFVDGFIYNDKRYFSEVMNNETEELLNIYVQNIDGTNTIQLISTESFDPTRNPGVSTTNGGLIFSIRPSGLHPRSTEKVLYRITAENEVIRYPIRAQGASGRGKNLGYMENTLYWTSIPVASTFSRASIAGYNEFSGIYLQYLTEYLDPYSYDPIFPLRTKSIDGIIYYAYTPGQLVENRILSNVGPRLLGVIKDDSGLTPVSVCKDVIGL